MARHGKTSDQPIVRELRVAKLGDVTFLSFSPDGRWLAVASERANVRICEVASASAPRSLPGTKGVFEAHFISNEEILTRHWDVMLWPLHGRRSRLVAASPNSTNRVELAISPDGARYVRVERDSSTREHLTCRELPDGTIIWQVEWTRSTSPTLLFSPDGRQLVTLVPKQVEFRNADTGVIERTIGKFDSWDPGHPPAASRPDGLALACRWDARIHVMNSVSGVSIAKLPAGDWDGCPIAFTTDGRLLAAGTSKGDVRFWDARTWKSHGMFDPGIGRVDALAFSRDGMLAAVGGADGRVVIWDLVDPETEFLGQRG